MIKYNEIINNLKDQDILTLMQGLGVTEYRETEKYFIFPTICHNIDIDSASHKLYYYKDNHFFYCFTECGGMSVFQFLKNYYELNNIAYDWFQDIYQPIVNCSSYQHKTNLEFNYQPIRDKYTNKKHRELLPSYSTNVLQSFSNYKPIEWINEGISEQAMEKYKIKFSISQNKIIIPHYDIQDRLIGIRGRALNEEDIQNFGKYMPIQIEQQWYSHPLSLNLYGLNWNYQNIKTYGVCYLFESEKSVLKLEDFDLPNCGVATCGSNFNKHQLDLLLRIARPHEVVICFDKENNDNNKYFNKLYKIASKYKKYTNISFIFDKNNLINLKDSPCDCGESIFKQLIQTRIRL